MEAKPFWTETVFWNRHFTPLMTIMSRCMLCSCLFYKIMLISLCTPEPTKTERQNRVFHKIINFHQTPSLSAFSFCCTSSRRQLAVRRFPGPGHLNPKPSQRVTDGTQCDINAHEDGFYKATGLTHTDWSADCTVGLDLCIVLHPQTTVFSSFRPCQVLMLVIGLQP